MSNQQLQMELFFKSIYNHPAITADNLREIMDAHERIQFTKGDMVLTEGQVTNAYYLIETGLFRAFVNNFDGKEITTEFYGQNQILIEVSSLFQRIPTQENLQALVDATVWKIDFEAFQKLFHKIEGFREWGRSWMSNQLFIAKQRSVNMLTYSATDRYLSLVNENPQIIQLAPLKYIATFLGITDTSLSRIRKEIHTD